MKLFTREIAPVNGWRCYEKRTAGVRGLLNRLIVRINWSLVQGF